MKVKKNVAKENVKKWRGKKYEASAAKSKLPTRETVGQRAAGGPDTIARVGNLIVNEEKGKCLLERVQLFRD